MYGVEQQPCQLKDRFRALISKECFFFCHNCLFSVGSQLISAQIKIDPMQGEYTASWDRSDLYLIVCDYDTITEALEIPNIHVVRKKTFVGFFEQLHGLLLSDHVSNTTAE